MEAARADLQYLLFSVVSEIVEQRRSGQGSTVLRDHSQPVIREIHRHACSLDESALRELHRKLAAGFLHEIDRLLSTQTG